MTVTLQPVQRIGDMSEENRPIPLTPGAFLYSRELEGEDGAQ